MRIHTFPLTCDVCGGSGLGTVGAATAAWYPRTRICHSDPQVCRDYLDRQRRDINRQREALAEKERKS